MAKRSTLPFPRVVPFPARCPACGYDLNGTEKLGRCPECGTPIATGTDCLAASCVPRRPPGPLWRRLVWIGIGIAMLTLSQTWPIIAFSRPWLMAVILAACTAAAVGMVMTGSPISKSTEQIVFTPVGFARSIWGKDESTLHPWTGNERIETRRIGKVWQRLTIERDGAKILDTGLRCDDSELDALAACIRHYATKTGPAPLDTFTANPADRPIPAAETPSP